MKKFILNLLAFSLSFLILSCGGPSSEKEYSDVTKPTKIKVTPQSEPETPKVQDIEKWPDPQNQTPADIKDDPVISDNAEVAPSVKGDEDNIIESLDYVGWEIDERSRDSKVCFAFRQPVDQNSNLILRDYIDISPSFKFAQTVSGNDLCLTGFDHAKDYTVTLKSGLPGIENRQLKSDVQEQISFGDKPQYVGFVGNGIILPRIGAQGLALETVNIEKLDVKVFRVSDRMIARRIPNVGQRIDEGSYGYEGRNAASQIRSEIWSGEVDVQNVKNDNVTTVLPLKEMIGELEAGAYIVSVGREHEKTERRYARAWRWVIVTDLAITTYRGESGINTTVRSIDTGELQAGVEMALIAQNNDILAKDISDGAGHVFFPPALLEGIGAKAPKMVLAYGKDQDFAALDLTRASVGAFSGQDISGRHVEEDIDIYAVSERGVYRPGETVHFTIMLRNREAFAQNDRPVTLSIKRPNGVIIETKRIETEEIEAGKGVINWSYEVPSSAQRGSWKLTIKPDGIRHNKNIGFSVEDFVPQKLRFDVKADTDAIKSGEIRTITGDAQFLYGAPGTELHADAEARLRLDRFPFKDYAAYTFGPYQQSFKEKLVPIGEGITDASGLVEFEFDNKANPYRSVYPMRAEVVLGVSEPGGRYIKQSINIPVRSEDHYIGIASNFTGQSVASGSPASFKIVALSPDGELLEKTLSWKLVQEDWDHQWYRHNGRWHYKYEQRDLTIDAGTIKLTANKPLVWDHLVGSGRYRLDIFHDDKAVASRRFWSGWGRVAGESEAPDNLEVNMVNETVKSGDEVKLKVRTPYAGKGELVIASDHVHLVRPVSLEEGTSEVSFKFDPEWGDSVYALMTLYTPRHAQDRPIPRRAVGVSYIALDRSPQTLELSINTPEVIRPRKPYVFEINVEGAEAKKGVMLNFAAVDEGILQITKYVSPDAPKHYFGKKALGISFNDDYGRILNPNLGKPADINTGSDSLGGEGLTVVPQKTVALYRGYVPVKNGVARIEMDIPDFNGELRLMATAWNDKAIGSVSAPLKVRDKVPTIISTPRFMAPGDKAQITLSLDNVEGAVGNYSAKLLTAGTLSAGQSPNFDLKSGERKQDFIDIQANSLGVAGLGLNISGPDNYAAESFLQMQVRSPYYPLTKTELVALDAGESLSLTSEWTDEFISEGTDVNVSFTKLPGIDPAPIVNSLRRYPYGCTEQTVSTALPLIYADDLGGIEGFTDISRKRAVQNAIYKLSNRVSKDGSFGLWRSGDRYAHSWVGIYATDFMFRAQKQGFYVPEDMLARVTEASRTLSLMPRSSSLRYFFERRDSKWDIVRRAEAAAYAHYVLAANGEGNIGKVRYHFENHRSKMSTPISYAYLGGALKLLGDDKRAEAAFEEAVTKIGHKDGSSYYYSHVRDLAGMVAIASEVGMDDYADERLVTLSEALRQRGKYLNTQEKGYLVLAFKSLLIDAEPPRVSAKNAELVNQDKNPNANIIAKDLEQNPVFTNQSDQKIWASVSIEGSPKEAPKPVSDKINIVKRLYNKKGDEISGEVEQGDEVVVLIEFYVTDKINRSIVIADLLPAGFEIETVLKPNDGNRSRNYRNTGSKGPYDWAGSLIKPQIAEKRDDRYVASMAISAYQHRKYPEKYKYKTAYVMRAVTPGEYTLPGVVIEDMYRPEDYGLSAAGQIKITPRAAP